MTSINLEKYGSDMSCPACCTILSHGDGSATVVQRRVADLISQNIPPTDAEAHDLQHADLDPTPYLAQIQQRIDELMNEIARLTVARAHLESHPHHVKGILHPIRSLPEDVLCEIFQWSIQDTEDSDQDSYDDSHDSLYLRGPQWVLSQVCRRWRDITLAFPHLWSSLYLSLGQFYVDPSPTSRSRLRLAAYLDRSANQKMTVLIELHSHFRSSDFVHLGPLLRQSTSRWIDCRLQTSFEFLDNVLSNCNFGSLACLRLQLYFEDFEDKKLDAFKNAPLLRSVDYLSSYHEDCGVQLPWERLITVKMGGVNEPLVYGPLKRLMNVQRLALQLSGLERSTFPLNRLRLPCVTSLRLSALFEQKAEPIGQLVSSLEMPSLTELELVSGYGLDSDSESNVDAAFRIVFPPFHSSVDLGRLTTLSIICQLGNDTDGVEKLATFLRLVPNLHRFRFESDISSAVFDTLTLRVGHSNLLPCLQILDFSGSDLNEDVGSIAQILSMLESRCPSRGKERSSCSSLTQLCLSESIHRRIGGGMAFDDGIRGRWDEISTLISIR